LKALILQGVLSDGFLLRKFGRIKAFVGEAELFDLVPDQVKLVLLLSNLVFLLFVLCLQVSVFIFELAGKFNEFILEGVDLVSLLQDLLLHLAIVLVSSQRIVLLISVISSLHLRLLDQHLLLDFVDFLLLFNLHLVHDTSILLSKLLNVVHQLLVRLLRLRVCLLQATIPFEQLLVVLICFLELGGKVALDRLVVASAKLEAEVV